MIEQKELEGMLLENYSSFEDAVRDAKFTSQLEAYLYMIDGRNVFVSGPAGSGKSYIIQKYCQLVQMTNPKVKIYKTSTTGFSALNIGGITIHSYSGQGIYPHSFEDYLKIKNIKDSALFLSSKRKIKETSILIVDEVSMLSARQLSFLIERIKSIKKSIKDIQIIFSGDFSQLQPVATKENIKDYGEDLGKFCYGTPYWKELDLAICYLDKIHRAKDTTLQEILYNISMGKGNTPENYNLLRKIKRTTNIYTPGVALLLTTNANVDKVNLERQSKNPNKLYTSKIEYEPRLYDKSREYAKQNNIPEELSIKVDDTVMVTFNDNVDNPFVETYYYYTGDDELYQTYEAPPLRNGMIGMFKIYKGKWAFKYSDETSKQEFLYVFPEKRLVTHSKYDWVNNRYVEIPIAQYKQYPLKLAYAISIHKSQGQTFENIATDLSNCWQAGLGYVALSRATNLSGLKLIENPGRGLFNLTALEVNKDSLKIKMDTLRESAETRRSNLKQLRNVFNNASNILENRFNSTKRNKRKNSKEALADSIFSLVEEVEQEHNDNIFNISEIPGTKEEKRIFNLKSKKWKLLENSNNIITVKKGQIELKFSEDDFVDLNKLVLKENAEPIGFDWRNL